MNESDQAVTEPRHKAGGGAWPNSRLRLAVQEGAAHGCDDSSMYYQASIMEKSS
jgi:hypothetical protein